MIPKVSVCLPVYNGERFLAQSIESVLSQTFTEFELLISDDCSEDNTYAIALSYADKDPRIVVWKNDERMGSAGNHNKCFEKGQASYIKPAHHDDTLHRTCLERMVAELDKRVNVALLSCAREILGPDDQVLSINRQFEADLEMKGMDAITQNLERFEGWVGEPPAVMFRREFLGQGFLHELHWFKDFQCWMEILQKGDYFFIADVLCRHRLNHETASCKNLSELLFLSDIVKLLHFYSQFLEKAGLSKTQVGRAAIKAALRYMDVAEHALKIDYSQGRAALALESNPIEITEMIILLLKNTRELEKNCDESAAEMRLASDECKTLSAAKHDLETELIRLNAEKRELESELAFIRGSKSWKLSAALRSLVRKSSDPSEG